MPRIANPFAADNKFGARRTWSELCERWFASKAEAIRGEELWMLQKAGEIRELEFQPRWALSMNPRVKYTADFYYRNSDGKVVVEDVKGRDTDASRVRRAWLKQRFDIEVVLIQSTSGSGR